MKLLITGGAGFIGSEFTRQAARSSRFDRIFVLDKLDYAADLKRLEGIPPGRIKFLKGDIAKIKQVASVFKAVRPDVVVNFAAQTHVDRSIISPAPFLASNTCGVFSLLEACRGKTPWLKKFIHVSTDEVYGELKGADGTFTEGSLLRPSSPYSATKAGADMLVGAYRKTYGLPCIICRPSNNYGPWQYPEKLIPVIIARALKDEPVPVYGRGLNMREWLYVGDCAEGILHLIKKGSDGETYNIGSGFERKNIEVVKAVLSLLGKPESLIRFVEDRPGHDWRYRVDAGKIRRQTGWRAETSFEEGIEKTVRWYLSNKEWLFEKAKRLRRYWAKVYKYK